MCRMSEFVIREAIIPDLKAAVKEGVIREMVQSIKSTGQFSDCDAEEIIGSVMRREQLGSTGIGRTLAIPHAKHPGAGKLIGTVALSKAGVPFDSIDGQNVHIIVLLISPQDQPGNHLRALESVVRKMRNTKFVEDLRKAETRDDIWKAITESGD
jgi:PTS system fructose-specific IIA component/PTS system nitrogen regulatory IIA component